MRLVTLVWDEEYASVRDSDIEETFQSIKKKTERLPNHSVLCYVSNELLVLRFRVGLHEGDIDQLTLAHGEAEPVILRNGDDFEYPSWLPSTHLGLLLRLI